MACEKEIEIDTRLGRRKIDPEKIIHFPRGLAGFEEDHEFTLLVLRPDAPLLILQSMRRPEVGLLVADPYSFLKSYPVILGDADQNLLKITDAADTAILVTVSIPEGKPEEAALNLKGPIVINHKARLGAQIIPETLEGEGKIYLRDLEANAERADNPNHAPAPQENHE